MAKTDDHCRNRVDQDCDHKWRINKMLRILQKAQKNKKEVKAYNEKWINKEKFECEKEDLQGKMQFLNWLSKDLKEQRIKEENMRSKWRSFIFRWRGVTIIRKMMLEDEMKELKLLKTEKISYDYPPIQLKSFDEKRRLEIKIKDNQSSLQTLFEKDLRICLKELLNRKQIIKKAVKRIGKEKKWIQENSNELVCSQGKAIGLSINIFLRKVRWKMKRITGMHRKTMWKGLDLGVTISHLPNNNKKPLELREKETETKISLENNCSKEGIDRNANKFNAKVCTFAILKCGSAVNCEEQSSKKT
jgi:hypothetical protein